MSQAPSASPEYQRLLATLEAVQRHAVAVWWSSTVLGVLGAAALLLAAAVLLDQFLVLPAVVRLLLLLLVIAGPALVLWRALGARPRASAQETALLIERRYPSLDNALINTLQLAAREGDEAAPIVAAVADEAGGAVEAVNPNAAVPKRWLAAAAAAVAVAALLVAAQAVADPASLGTGLGRVLVPLGDNTLTRIVEVSPGGGDVLLHSSVTVAARLEGRVPSQALLVVQRADGRRVTYPMTAPSASVPDRLTAVIDRLDTDAIYHVVAGDDRSDRYELRVHAPPAIHSVTQTITPPAYIGGKPTEQAGGDIRALAGSRVELRIVATEPLRDGRIVLVDGGETPLEVVGSSAGGAGADGGSRSAVATLTVERPTRYAVALTSAHGFPGEPVSFEVLPLEDALPQVEIVQPGGDVAVDIDAKVVVEVRATDDHAVRKLDLVREAPEAAESSQGREASAGEMPPPARELASWSAEVADARVVQRRVTLSVAELGLSEETPIVLRAAAIDHRPQRAAPATSRPITIRLKAPPQEEPEAAPQVAKVSLDALIAKQRANLDASERVRRDSAERPSPETALALVTRQEEVRADALALAETAAGPTGNPAVRQRLGDLAETLMVLAIEQLRTAAAAPDPRPSLPSAIDTQRAILRALVAADARQEQELAGQRQRELAAALAELIARQQALHTDTQARSESATALAARQTALGRDAARLQRQFRDDAAAGAHGNAELALAYGRVADAFEQRAVRANMLVAVERLGQEQTPEAVSLQAKVIEDLLEIQKILRAQALSDAQEELADATQGLEEAKEKIDRLVRLQQAITEIARDLQKQKDVTEGLEAFAENLKDLVETRQNIADAIEQLTKDMHLLPEMSASNDLLPELSEIFESVRQAPGSENAAVSEEAVSRDEGVLAALKAMQEKMGERIGDLEMWLSDKPDSAKWNQESFDRDEMGTIPLGDLPDALEDIVGDLVDQAEELSKEAEDSASNVGLPDAIIGWDIADGPMPSWAAKGKSGNEKPNANEQTGRSGAGRQGASSGEVAGDTIKALEGADVETRRTNDAFQAGELQEEDPSAMEVKATGGGKLAGVSPTEGMQGDAPPRDELRYRELARMHRELERQAETVYSKAKLMRLPTGELDRAILEMDAASRRLADGDVAGYARSQDAVVRALRETLARLSGRTIVEAPATERQQRHADAAGATQEPVPVQYEDAVAEYMRRIAQQER